ncbi:adenylate cyclase [Nitzschia inconspicua]|uniref:Adenylate cyclase n=1 Tax=Nitzschia inconspicua TaxID=303405 RepID=A0A9K3Q2P2_9STRA|nr:adenylate cyclase [Nitzschia inconspicua]
MPDQSFRSNSPPSGIAPVEEKRPRFSNFRRKCMNRDVWLQNVSEIIVNSVFWKFLIITLTLLLLFGSPIQFWAVSKEVDVVFDALYIFGFVFFMIDIVLNSYADPRYLECNPFHRKMRRSHKATNTDGYYAHSWSCGVGSFNFWCDLISSIGFLYDVSFINQAEFFMHSMYIELDRTGVPINFDVVVNEAQPFEPNINFILVIFKAARVARLVPSTKVVALSERMNIYWYFERITPCYWWNKFRERRERAQRIKENSEGRKGSKRLRRNSWGGLEIAALAVAKATADEDRKVTESFNSGFRMWAWCSNCFRWIGMLPNSNVELNRHIAATKIQRAWRNRLFKPAADTRSDDDLIEIGEGGHGYISGDSLLSSTLKKRSMLSRSTFSAKSLGRISENPILGKKHQPTPTSGDSKSFSHGNKLSRVDNSQVGTAMAEVTGQRVGLFILLSLLFAMLFTYVEFDSTKPSTMVVLHGQVIQTSAQTIARKAVETARLSSVPYLYLFKSNSTYYGTDFSLTFNLSEYDVDSLRDREKMRIVINNTLGTSEGFFVVRQDTVQSAQVELIATFFVLLVWFFGVAAFTGPIMTFVILPIERMVRLLGMLMMDPLGYQSNLRFKNFLLEEDQIVKKSQWTREVLKGMETSFLMSTILRIGSLMKVGFGSAGVEIIRNNLQMGQSTNELILNSQGSTVSCIFLFCDIRQFTDATECLQEEVFVFTNKIAAVVHSICHSYGGSANKNVGDAFLVSWLLEDEPNGSRGWMSSKNSQTFVAKQHQADKALLSVVKICIALHHDYYYIETMSNHPRTALLNKLKNRPGPIVQMGFGLHAGNAVQGAIGSQRKIDATYVSEAVERAEFLESSTKKYKLQMLMSDDFYRLLHSSNRRRCRKIDKVMFRNDDDDEFEEEAYDDEGDIMELYTYDMEVDALWEDNRKTRGESETSLAESDEGGRLSNSRRSSGGPSVSRSSGNSLLKKTRRMSIRNFDGKTQGAMDDKKLGSLNNPVDNLTTPASIAAAAAAAASSNQMGWGSDDDGKIQLHHPQDGESTENNATKTNRPELVLPTGPSLYSANVWLQYDMRRIRRRYTPVVINTFGAGLEKYYAKDWEGARQCFEAVMERFDDGPSKYFLTEMKKHNYVPPPHFQPYGIA